MKFFAFFLLVSHYAIAAEFGTFMIVKGNVFIEDANAKKTAAVLGSKIYVGETVITEKDSRAKIVMQERRNVLNILPNTKLKIEKYTNTATEKNVQINLIEGQIRSNVGEKYDNKSSKFEIRTSTAVAGVRGTQFITSYDAKTKVTEVIAISGKVFIKSFMPGSGSGAEANGPEVIVTSREKTEIKENSEPSEPVKLPKKEFDNLNQDTDVKKDKNLKDGKSGKNAVSTGNEIPTDNSIGGDNQTKPPETKPPGGLVGGTAPIITPEKTDVRIIIVSPGN